MSNIDRGVYVLGNQTIMKTNILLIILGALFGFIVLWIFIRVSQISEDVAYVTKQNETIVNKLKEIDEMMNKPLKITN